MTKRTIRSVPDLLAAELVSPEDVDGLVAVAKKYAVAISPHLQEIITRDGVQQQFVPTVQELDTTTQELHDPVGDKTYSPLKGIVHRYPDRCLLQPVTVCPVYCRFCFRRETVGQGNPALTPTELQACYAYIRANPDIWEVILSGGDPLILKGAQIGKIIKELDQIEHVEIIRLHTRVPIVDPQRINEPILRALTQRQPIYIVLHINHPAEFILPAIAAINKLVDNGIVLLGQTVLLKGVNDTVKVLGQLLRQMVKYRIKPYYLHHLDMARGTGHFRLPIVKGQELVAGLRGNYSGLCQPQYVLDIPGGGGKTPIGPNYLIPQEQGYKVTSYTGAEHEYFDT